MIDLALDPSETRSSPETAQRRSAGRPWARMAVLGVLGVAGTGIFASAASTYLSGLAGPQRVRPTVTTQKAADWPDLKDGLPALATGGPASVPKVREILPPEPARPPVVEARIEQILRADTAATARPTVAIAPSESVSPASATKPLPAIVAVPVIGPAREAALVPPARTVPGIAPLASETVRARTESATDAALPPEGTKSLAPVAEPIGHEATKPEAAKAKPRIEVQAKPPVAARFSGAGKTPVAVKAVADTKAPIETKSVADKPAARKAAVVEAKASPAEAQEEDTEVFGIKVPSLAPAGRKIRESVEALGDAVKGIPDRF